MWHAGSRQVGFTSCGSRVLERRLSSCGRGSMWDLPRSGLEPVYPALAGEFLNTAPPGKPENIYFSVLFCASYALSVKDTKVNKTQNLLPRSSLPRGGTHRGSQ